MMNRSMLRAACATTLPVLLLLASAPAAAVKCKANVNPAGQTSVAEGTIVTLDASPSTPAPSSGTITSYVWSQPLGQGIVFLSNNVSTGIATFLAPQVGPGGLALTFTATVNGSRCDGPSSESTIVNVTNVLTNAAPSASAFTTPEPASEGQTVTLNGSASQDPDGDAISYLWTQVAGTPQVAISNATSAIASIVAPNTAYPSGASFTFRLRVSDGLLHSETDEIVNVVWTNDKPVAALTCPSVVNEGDAVTLSAAGSSDPEGVALTYAWQQLDGPPYVPAEALTPTPSIAFAAPSLGYHNLGFLPFRVTVSDGTLSDSKECTIEVKDVTPPVFSGVADQQLEATSSAGAEAYFNVTATDAVDGGPFAATCDANSGDVFPLGPTLVSCSAADSIGNVANDSFTITVSDTTAPVIAPHDPVVEEATSADGAESNYAPPATSDIVDGAGEATCVPAPGSLFPIGTTAVNCTATDAAGNDATSTSFDVIVKDTTAPNITPPANVQAEATGVLTTVDPGTATATDAVGPVTISRDPASNDFPLGTTTIEWKATDAYTNSSVAYSTVTIVDTTPPTVTVPADITAEATGPSGAVVTFSASASDLVDGALSASCDPAPDSIFALGTTQVTCSATDAAGNTGSASLNVKVQDTTPPTVSVPASIIAEATGPSGAVVTFSASASDLVDGAMVPVCVPASGSTFALGTTTVTCTATDNAGNSGSNTFTVTVQDTTPPTIAPHANVVATATSASGAIVNYTLPTATDLVDGSVAVTCVPASGSQFPLGAKTVHCSATDAAGNTGHSSFTVTVSFAFNGFFRPIDNLPVVNVVKAGQSIPVKFSLGGNMGLNIFAAGYPKSNVLTCSSGAPTDVIEETVTAGGSSLSYDPLTGQYNYVWKTDKGWAGQCRQLIVQFADGNTQVANFNFTR